MIEFHNAHVWQCKFVHTPQHAPHHHQRSNRTSSGGTPASITHCSSSSVIRGGPHTYTTGNDGDAAAAAADGDDGDDDDDDKDGEDGDDDDDDAASFAIAFSIIDLPILPALNEFSSAAPPPAKPPPLA